MNTTTTITTTTIISTISSSNNNMQTAPSPSTPVVGWKMMSNTFCRGVAGLAAYTIIYRRRRLYAGYRLHLLRDAIGTAIYFTTSESAKQLMANALWPVPTGTSCDTFCSAPGAVITALSCPFELTKLNEQLAGKVAREAQSKTGQNPSPIVNVKSGGSWNTARRLFRDRGVLGLYAGYRLHLLRDTIGTAIYFNPGRRRRS
ncbi:hypothetical protein KC332_g2042 [Hortaea werneckii]|nr:hypothetical protein KC350_g5850 [Hortaea werneckii]KAI6995102.1 hypothetical protein KC329_g2543 [Hortaea werneckii]KAI7276399.1 hypothetical protein KC335_g739 [Hortaea werneckii]KAI7418225.1 hypothetical protein KC332_g2042 [Hortaea werneckii]KAI7446667.1 hypothetical protein KC336_g1122 [Hortaea werneckii]